MIQTRKIFMSLSAFATILGLSRCASDTALEPIICIAVESPGIMVEVRDASTNAPAAAGAVGIARDGAFSETLNLLGWSGSPSDATALVLGGIVERVGTYTVTVEKAGYQLWQRSDIVVTRALCGVNRVTLEARLVPE